ncbi:MAG: DJ-1/PfpI family protein [Gammaproteobacteria bacterium]|nr:DJ-1/PfpI family protein [Gammaproteobacteria bacterium]MDH5729683.1 DJ-1/PfpI family protein [Gammaproteobacteria bacterium]
MATVLIPLAQGCEELEAVTIIDLCRRANFDVTTVSLSPEPILAARGTKLIADKVIDEVMDQEFDCIALPGGLPGADNLSKDERIKTLLTKHHQQQKIIGAICAAPRVLLLAGIVDGRRITSFPGTLHHLDTSNIEYVEIPVVIDGHFVTSRGPGTAMDFALCLIEILAGVEARLAVESPLQRPKN